jgi:tetratricopeptide (TPR) repeat protein
MRWSRAFIALLAAALSPSVASEADAWRKGQEAVAAKRWVEAVLHFREVRQAHPEQARGWLMEGYALGMAGRRDDALGCFREVLDRDPSQPDALFFLAEEDRRRHDDTAALAKLNRIGTVPENLYQSYHQAKGALLVMTNGDPATAAKHLEIGQPLPPDLRTLLALARLRSGSPGPVNALLTSGCVAAGPSGPSTSEWLACLDSEYCGELLDERLEIAGRLVFREEKPSPTDASGRMFARTKLFETTNLSVPLRPGEDGPTLYARWGDWPVALLALGLALATGRALFAPASRRRRHPRSVDPPAPGDEESVLRDGEAVDGSLRG